MATEKDFYDILGVSRGANEDEIKKAYRKQAMKYHPDRNPGDKVAEDKFKEASEAYEVLSNSEKRKMYDQFGHAAFQQGGGAGGGFQGGFNFNDIFGGGGMGGGGVFDDIFDTFFGGGGTRGRTRQSGPRKTRGSDIRADISLKMIDILQDKNLKLKVRRNEVCDTCNGSGSKSGKAPTTCQTCGGSGTVRTSQGFFTVQTTCPTCHGNGSQVSDPCPSCRGSGTREKDSVINVKIPAGVEDGMRLRVSGEGDVGQNGGPRGDLYVLITVNNDSEFQREGKDLYAKLKISYPRAIFGGKIPVSTIEGEKQINIPAGVQVGHQIRIKGEGMPDIRSKVRGDIYFEIVIDVPKNLSGKAKNLLKDFASETGEHL